MSQALPTRTPGVTLQALMSTGPVAAGSPLSGPIAVPAAASRRDPAHWHPQYQEPIYREVYEEMRDRLHVALDAGLIGEVLPPC